MDIFKKFLSENNFLNMKKESNDIYKHIILGKNNSHSGHF